MDKNKKDSILIKNTNTRNENLLNNKGKYRAYGKDLGLIVGESYNVYGNEKNSSNKSQHLDILRYTHNGKTDFSKDIHENYGVNGETLKYYVGNNVKPSYTVNNYDGFSDYISYIWDIYGQEESYAGHLLGLLGVRDLAEDLAYDMVPDFKGKTATDVINEILQYTDIKYAMEGERVGIVKDIDVAMAVLGAVTTNKNNYSGKDTRMGMISNRMYGGTLLNAARFNSLRRSKYITPELERLYGNNLHNVYNLSSLFRINEETGRIAEPDSNNYIHELPVGNVFDYLPTVIHDFKLPEGEYDWSIHPNYGPNELKYTINYKGETKFDTKGGSYGLTDRRGIFIYSEGDNKNELEVKDYSNYRFNEVESVASMNVVDVVDEIDMTEETLLQKTNDFLRKRKINTIISRFHDKDNRKGGMTQSSYSPTFGISHGRNLLTKNAWENGSADIINGYTNPYCRVWTNHHQYSKMKHLIRPFISDETFTSIEELQKDWISFRTENAAQRLSDFGVLNKNGMVNITPSLKDGIDIKKCMFSIENLAWKDVITSQEGKYRLNKNNGSSNSQYDWEVDNENVLSEEQRGPNGGRIMWFPPYELTFQETASADWSENKFIGRGEPVYTYNNSTRSGTLEFTILVDHPAIVDYWMENKRDNATEDDEQSLLRFFAGCDPLGESKDTLLALKEDANKEKVKDPKEIIEEKDIVFYTFFPNNFSGVDDKGMGIDRIFGGMGRNDLKVKTDSGDFYLGYEMGINPMSIDSFSVIEQNNPAIWMLENIYTVVDAEKKFEDIESVTDVVDSLSLSVDDESGIAYYLCDCTIEKYEELCEKINSSDDEEIEEGTIQFIEEIDDIFQISAPLSKTNALFIYYNYSGSDVNIDNATTDELIESCTWEGETAISAYARYKCRHLKTYNTKGNEKPYEIINEKQEVACKTIDESSVERYWYIKFQKSNKFPYEKVKNKREFSRLNLNFGVKEDKSKYFVKFNDDVYSFDNDTDSFNFIVNNNLLTKVESKDDFMKKGVKYGFNKNDETPYYYYSIEVSNGKDIMEHIKSALEDEGDEKHIIKKYYEGHKFGCLKDFGVGENYGVIQFFITGKLQKNGYGYDSVQDFIARHDIQKHNEKTPVWTL